MTTTGPDFAEAICSALCTVAPDADVGHVGPDDDLIESLGLDSMDLLNVVAAVAQRTGLEVPERDYPALRTMRGFLDELAKLAEAQP